MCPCGSEDIWKKVSDEREVLGNFVEVKNVGDLRAAARYGSQAKIRKSSEGAFDNLHSINLVLECRPTRTPSLALRDLNNADTAT
jgi:hypothetical protein